MFSVRHESCLNSKLTWKVLLSTVVPTAGNKTLEMNLYDCHEVMVQLYSNPAIRQSITFRRENIISDAGLVGSVVPDFYFAGNRLYFKITGVNGTTITISDVGNTGSIPWGNPAAMIVIFGR